MNRIDLVYPKMPGSAHAPLRQCIAFEKYDGTNLHWIWDTELQWHAFGTRRDRYDLDESGIHSFMAAHAGLEEAPEIFLESFAQPLTRLLRSNPDLGRHDVIIFTEFLGEESFAGKHKRDDRKRLVLIDVSVAGVFMPPDKFTVDFAQLPIARVIYQGKLNGRFVEAVRTGKYDVFEGVVCKGEVDGRVWMVKIKTDDYMKKLKEAFKQNWESFWE